LQKRKGIATLRVRLCRRKNPRLSRKAPHLHHRRFLASWIYGQLPAGGVCSKMRPAG
jgi:hypothetical protein